MSDDSFGGGQDITFRTIAPLVLDASAERWFLLREPVPFGFEMFFIKNQAISARYSAGIDWTPSVPLWHLGGVKAVVVDVRSRCVPCAFPSELHTRDQASIKLDAAVHFRVADPARLALQGRDLLGEVVARTRARLVDVTLNVSLEELSSQGAAVYTEGSGPLEASLSELGVEFRKLEVISLALPAMARDEHAEAANAEPPETAPQPAPATPATPPPTWCLVNLATQVVHPLGSEVTIIGRGAGRMSQPNDIRLVDDYASRQHLQVVTTGSEVVVTNLSSVNAVVVNDQKSLGPGEQTKLEAGDVVEVGYTRLKLIER